MYCSIRVKQSVTEFINEAVESTSRLKKADSMKVLLVFCTAHKAQSAGTLSSVIVVPSVQCGSASTARTKNPD